MLRFHFANRYETLAAQLLAELRHNRGGVFAADQIIVPSAAVRRALTLAIADHDGICANVHFSFLARWLWQQIARVVPAVADESPFAPAVLTWRIYAAFGASDFVAAHPRLASYLGDADEVMRLDLAARVATLFDQYLTYRPDWLAAWRDGRTALDDGSDVARADEGWQRALWCRIGAALGLDALQPMQAYARSLEHGGAACRGAGLPPSAHVFVLPTMPPLHLQLLEQLARVVDVHVYVLNPCREYWFEVVDRRRLSHLALRGLSDGHEEDNRLLAAWGRQTQAFVDLLLSAAGAEDGRFEADPKPTLLAHLRNAILDLREIGPCSVPALDGDRSIEVHVCHSLTRELEVLHDHLLGLFAAQPGLRPGDVLVVTPDLEAAAPLIDAIFGTAPSQRHIPYGISGRARSGINAPARALLAVLELAGSRVVSSAVFSLLQQAVVARRYALTDSALQQIHDWMLDSGMRWALDAEHRAAFDVPAQPQHTLADGLERLFLGHALPERVDAPFDERLAAGDAEGSAALALGTLWRYIGDLRRLQATISVPQTPAAWADVLLAALATFTAAAGDELEDLRELQQAIAEMVDTMQRGGLDQPVPLAVARAALEQLLDDPARGGVPTGGVTFSSMSSLRGLPFAVVCVIGLDDGRFPTTTRPSEFDLMALQPRRGDRQRRSDERNLFLDLLLAARDSFYISYCGRSVRDNAPLPPSVLVAELLDVLIPAVADGSSAAALALARARLVVEHPLQPFSIDAYSVAGDPRQRSYNRELGDALRSSLGAPRLAWDAGAAAPADDDSDALRDEDDAHDALAPFFGTTLAPPGPEWRDVTLAQLAEFFRNPCRYLLRHRLGIELQRDADELEDDEPFVPDRPARNALARRLLPHLLRAADIGAVRRLAAAGTEMPAGAFGRRQLERELVTLAGFADRVRGATAAPCRQPLHAALAVTLDGESWRIDADWSDLRVDGLVRWRCDELRPSDKVEAWLQHLALCAAAPAGVAPRTHWLALDRVLHLEPSQQPLALLRELVALYRRGLSEPLHFFPKSACSYVENGDSIYMATQVWQPTPERPYAEGADAGYRLALRGQPNPLDDSFHALAHAVFDPLNAHIGDGA